MRRTNTPPARTIVEEELITKRIEKAQQEYPRVGEMFEAIKWVLARNPLRGAKRVPNMNPIRYMIKTRPWKPGRVPSLTVVFHVNEHEVIISGLKVTEE